MTDPFLGEIRIFAGNYAPPGWALCNGQLMAIQPNAALFALLGVAYGGNGSTTFALPNLQGSAPMQQGQGQNLTSRELGEPGGEEVVALPLTQMPAHTHTPHALAGSGTTGSPANAVWAQAQYGRVASNIYSTAVPNVAMNPLATQPNGGGLSHNNMPPYLTLTFIIALQGLFPQR
jgi:microcystin-dependent protein